METIQTLNDTRDLSYAGIDTCKKQCWNLPPEELIELAIKQGEGVLTDTGALMIDTGKFTGRSPDDKFFVCDDLTRETIHWGAINHPTEPSVFFRLFEKVQKHAPEATLYIRDVYACAAPEYRFRVRVITTTAAHNLFVANMFIAPEAAELEHFQPDFTVVFMPELKAEPTVDGTRSPNFAVIDIERGLAIVGGTGYTGEIKKGGFSVLNYLMPIKHNVLPMHSSANVGKNGDVAIFFGLSGTGKTTLSTDLERSLVGDDEHGWSDNGIFNFEGGCYAKVINLSQDDEPEIYDAIRFRALLENTRFIPGTRKVDYRNTSVTQNTRVSYPLNFIPGSIIPSVAGLPSHIFFLTADAFGVLPPIAQLNKAQAMFHFVSGYTSKVAGTEMGITDPVTVFSACFGEPFMPLHPVRYAELLGQKMEKHQVKVWLLNTGWTGGPYGIGKRMKLAHTRSTIHAAMDGSLDNVEYDIHPVFGIKIPKTCPNVPIEILDPRKTWKDVAAYDEKAHHLAKAFLENAHKYQTAGFENVMKGAPLV